MNTDLILVLAAALGVGAFVAITAFSSKSQKTQPNSAAARPQPSQKHGNRAQRRKRHA